jgi:hypothetical protein
MKLTDFQKKRSGIKIPILAPRLVLQAVGIGDSSHTNSSWDHFGEPTYTR